MATHPFQSNGQLRRPSITRNTPLLVISGAMAVYCMRYGVWDVNHLQNSTTLRHLKAIGCENAVAELLQPCYNSAMMHVNVVGIKEDR